MLAKLFAFISAINLIFLNFKNFFTAAASKIQDKPLPLITGFKFIETKAYLFLMSNLTTPTFFLLFNNPI